MSQVSCEQEKTLALLQQFHIASFLTAMNHPPIPWGERSKQIGHFWLQSILISETNSRLQVIMKYRSKKTEFLTSHHPPGICMSPEYGN